MDLLPSLRDSATADVWRARESIETDIVPRPTAALVPNDELSIAEIDSSDLRVGPLRLYAPGALGDPVGALQPRARRSPAPRFRMLLPGHVRRPARGTALRGVAALFAVVVAAAVLSRPPGDAGGTVYPAGAAGALLTAADLGEMWAEGGLTFDLGAVPTAAYDPNGFARGNCGRTAADPTTGAVAARSATFNNGNRFISDTIGVFSSATVAHQRYTAYRSALAACRRWTATTSDGGQLALRLDPVKAETIGEESGVYRMEGVVTPAKSGLPQSTAVQAAVVVMRRLNAVSIVAEMSIGYLGQSADARTSDATLAASVADAKLARLATINGPLRGGGDDADDEQRNFASSTDQRQDTGLQIGTPHLLSTNDGGKVAVTVVQVLDPATGEDGYVPKPGSRFVAVQIRLGNVGERTYDDSPENGALLIDARGEQHYADLAEISAGDGFGGHVRMGVEDTRTGYIVFQVPQGVAVKTFQFALDSGFAPSMGQWSLAGAASTPAQPPASNL